LAAFPNCLHATAKARESFTPCSNGSTNKIRNYEKCSFTLQSRCRFYKEKFRRARHSHYTIKIFTTEDLHRLPYLAKKNKTVRHTALLSNIREKEGNFSAAAAAPARRCKYDYLMQCTSAGLAFTKARTQLGRRKLRVPRGMIGGRRLLPVRQIRPFLPLQLF
jgi:hypothetical protein